MRMCVCACLLLGTFASAYTQQVVSQNDALYMHSQVWYCASMRMCVNLGGGGYVACVSSAALLAHAHTHAPAHIHPPLSPQQLHYQLEMARANLHENFARLQHQSLSGLFISQVIQENLEVYNM